MCALFQKKIGGLKKISQALVEYDIFISGKTLSKIRNYVTNETINKTNISDQTNSQVINNNQTVNTVNNNNRTINNIIICDPNIVAEKNYWKEKYDLLLRGATPLISLNEECHNNSKQICKQFKRLQKTWSDSFEKQYDPALFKKEFSKVNAIIQADSSGSESDSNHLELTVSLKTLIDQHLSKRETKMLLENKTENKDLIKIQQDTQKVNFQEFDNSIETICEKMTEKSITVPQKSLTKLQESIEQTAELYIEAKNLALAKDETNFLENIPNSKLTKNIMENIFIEWKRRFGNSYLKNYLELKPRYKNLGQEYTELSKKYDTILLNEKKKLPEKLLKINKYLTEQLSKTRQENAEFYKSNETLSIDAESNFLAYQRLEEKYEDLEEKQESQGRELKQKSKQLECKNKQLEKNAKELNKKDKQLEENEKEILKLKLLLRKKRKVMN